MESEQSIKELNTISRTVKAMGVPETWDADDWDDWLLMSKRAALILRQNEVKCCACGNDIEGTPLNELDSFEKLLCPTCFALPLKRWRQGKVALQ